MCGGWTGSGASSASRKGKTCRDPWTDLEKATETRTWPGGLDRSNTTLRCPALRCGFKCWASLRANVGNRCWRGLPKTAKTALTALTSFAAQASTAARGEKNIVCTHLATCGAKGHTHTHRERERQTNRERKEEGKREKREREKEKEATSSTVTAEPISPPPPPPSTLGNTNTNTHTHTQHKMAITRLWFFTLKPNISPTDPVFLALWAQILTLCASYTPTPTASSSQVHVAHISTPHPQRPHHSLFFSSSSPSSSSSSPHSAHLFVLISTYPSLALCSQADAAYRSRFQPRLFEMVQHLALRQMDMEETETVPALLAASAAAPPAKSAVTVTISSRDPLRVEVQGGGGAAARGGVPPIDEEISGADVYQVPPAPLSARTEENGSGQNDVFGAQRHEGRKWIRIARGWDVVPQEGEVEVFKLKEVMSR